MNDKRFLGYPLMYEMIINFDMFDLAMINWVVMKSTKWCNLDKEYEITIEILNPRELYYSIR